MTATKMSKSQKRAVREAFNRFLSVLLTFAMVLQTSPVAYARWDEGAVEPAPAEEYVPEEVAPEEVATEEPAPQEAPAEEPAPEVAAPAPEPQAVPALTGLVIENKTTDSVLASSTEDNHLVFKLAYESLEPGASYTLTVEPMDRRTPEAIEAQQVLLGEPYYIEENDEWRQDPFVWTTGLVPAEAAGEQVIDLEKVDLHYVAGASYPLRVTLTNAEGVPVAQRTFDGEFDAMLYVPAIASTLHAADGTQQLAAEDEAAALTDTMLVTGLPKNTEISVTGALATTEGVAVAAGSATFTTDEWGNAITDLNYPAFAAKQFAGKQVNSTLAINVLDRYENQKNITTYPSPQGKARKDEPAAQVVTVAEAVPAEAGEGDAATEEESDGEDADADSEQGEPAAPVELDPTKTLEEQLDPTIDQSKIKSDASVAYGEGDTLALTLQGEAATDPAKAVDELSKKVGRGEALMLASKLGAPMGVMSDGGAKESNAPALDGMTEGLTVEDKEADDTNIEDLQVKWITEDEFEDGELSLLSLRPGMVDGRNDANQSVVAQIDYSLSGERDYAAGDIRIMVPAVLFTTRDGKQAGGVVIPLPQAPSKNDDFNWTLVDGYYVFENTRPMSAATKGFIQVMWANLRPHEIADAFANIYDDGNANKGANEEASYITGENQTKDWYAYMEVTTYRGNTIKAASDTINAQMDTGETINAGYKRVTSNSPYTVSASDLPAGSIPEQYADETRFVVVDWYMYARYRGNQPFSLDVKDQLSVVQDTVTVDGQSTPLEKPGFIYAIDANGEKTYSENRDTLNATGIYSGWPNLINGETAYVHVYSAYPYSQFTAGPQYTFHNQVTYTLNPIDGKDTPTIVTASAQIPFTLHESSFREPPGHFNVFKWGNDGWEDQATWDEYDYVAHNPKRESETISRRGYRQHYNGWYGIYEDAINQLAKGEDVTLWYTIKTEGWVLPWTLGMPADAVKTHGGISYDGYQWAKFDKDTNQYVPRYFEDVPPEWFDAVSSSTVGDKTVLTVDTSKTDGYDLVEFYRIQENYLKRPVTMITTDNGLYLDGTIRADGDNYQRLDGGTKLTPGVDYVFDYLEFDKPEIGDVVGVNIEKGETFSVSYSEDGTFDYARSYDDSKIPVFDVYVQVNGEWQSEPYATVDWTSGSPVITSSGEVMGATLKLPENTTNFQTNSTTTQNAYFMEWIYPGVTLTDNGEEKLLEEYSKAKFGTEDDPIYQPSMWVQNGVKMDVYEYGKIRNWSENDEPSFLLHLEKYGEDRLDGYTGDMGVYPSKEADFDQITDVDYEQRVATVHYTAKVEERTFITDEETYNKLVEDGTITKETSGIWYDLLPEGMTPVMDSVKLRDDDDIKNKYTEENWKGTGRTMLIVEADLTPTPTTYKQSDTSAVKYWEDVPTLKFDAVMDLDTWTDMGGSIIKGIKSHNVVAFESTSESTKELGTLGTLRDHKGEPDRIDRENGNNERTRRKTFTDEEVEAFNNVDEATDDPLFVYADCTTQLAFPTAARTSLFKNIMVNDDGRWSQGTYDDVRTVWEGGFYSYRLRMMSDTGTKSKNLVLYDTLENYYAVDGNDEVDINAPRWRGEFIGLDLSQITDMGCKPVVYYSTIDNLVLTDPENARRSNAENIDISNGEIWTPADEYTGELKDVHAIAIDCTKNNDGEDFILESGNTLTAIIKMHAPWGTELWDDFSDVTDFYQGDEYSSAHGSARDYIKADAHAYNNVYLVSTSIDASSPWPEDSESTRDFIRHDYTKVGLKEYSVPVTKKWDDDDNRDGIRPESVEVTLYANGEPAGTEIVGENGNTRVLSNKNDWSNTFNNLPYTDSQGKQIYYTVRETKVQTPEGYVGRVSGSVAEGFTVTNKHIPELTRVEGTKTWEADEDDPSTRPSYITVQLYANGVAKESIRVEPDADGNWPTYSFENLYKYENGEEIEYTVEEKVPEDAYTSEVKGYDIINTFHPKGDVSITKKVSGATEIVADKTYDFKVVIDSPLVDSEGNPVTDDEGNQQYEPLQDSFEYESSTGATDTVKSGDTLTLAGDEKVTIKELPHGTRVTFTESEYPGFTASSDGIVSTTVRQNRERELKVTNTYRTSGKAAFKAHKDLTGAELRNNKFIFEVVDSATNERVRSAANRADGSVTFGEIPYDNTDDGQTYTYIIREIVPDEAVKTLDDGTTVTWAEAKDEQKAGGGFKLKGYTYDSTTYYTAKVTIKDNGEGELEVQTVYTDADGNVVEEPEFNVFENKYEAKGSTSMTAWKVLDDGGIGRSLQNEEFSFELTPVRGEDAEGNEIAAENVPMPKDVDGNVLNPDTKKNDEKGVIKFDKIEYTQDDAGNTYYYTAREIPGDDSTVVYSTATYGYKVTVVDNGDGTLSVVQGNVTVENRLVEEGGTYHCTKNIVAARARDDVPPWRADWQYTSIYNSVIKNYFNIDGAVEKTATLNTVDIRDAILNLPTDGNVVYNTNRTSVSADQMGDTETVKVTSVKSFQGMYTLWITFDWYEETDNKYETVIIEDEEGELPVFTNSLKSGSLSIEKAIQGEGADPSKEFTFHVKLTGDNVDPNATYAYDLVQVDNSTSDSNGTNNGKAAQTAGRINLPNPVKSLVSFFKPTKAYAAIQDWTQYTNNGSTIEWMIDDNGVLTIRPINGDEGILNFSGTTYGYVLSPWSNNKDIKSVIIPEGCNITCRGQLAHMFRGCSNLVDVDLRGLDLSSVRTTIGAMFDGCSSLTTANLSGWDTSSVTGMSNMFNGCKSLTTLDMSGWDTSSVTSMASMFKDCSNLTEIDVTGFDTSSVTNMASMFNGCKSLTELDVSGFDTSSVTGMGYMFAECESLTELDVSDFDTSNVTSMNRMFYKCAGLTELDVSNFDTSSVVGMESMFGSCSSLTELDVSNFDTSSVTTMEGMFAGCSGLNSLDVSDFDTKNVTTMRVMFSGCTSLTSLDISDLDTSSVTNMNSMFNKCSGLTSLDVSDLDTSSVTDMGSMFSGCSGLTSLDVSELDTSSVTNMASMFSRCSGLTSLDVSALDTSNVTSMQGMFANCDGLTTIDVSTFDTSKVTITERMFSECDKLETINLNGFDTTKNSSPWMMFEYCPSLSELDLSSFEIMDNALVSNMFNGDKSLKRVVLGEGFKFKTTRQNFTLPVPSGTMYTGKWIRVDENGSYIEPAYSSTQLKDNWDSSLAGTWVWEQAKLVLHFDKNSGDGSMDDYYITQETFTLPANQFTNDLGEFVGWDDNSVGTKKFDDKDVVDVFKNGSTYYISKPGQHGIGPNNFTYNDGIYEKTLVAHWNYTKYSLEYDKGADEAAGSMAKETVIAAEDHSIASNSFYWFKHRVTGWDVTVVDKNDNPVTRKKTHYGLNDTIAADDFKAGDKVTLTAVWEDIDTSAQASNGEFTITLHGGERAIFNDLPAGTAYEVWEETESGWKLIKVVDSEGVIQPTEISEAEFTNEYVEVNRETKQSLGATKMLKDENGEPTDVTAGQFSFRLYDSDGNLLQTVSNDDQGNISFDELTFTEKGTYTYTIREVQGSDESIEYDSEPITATIVVSETPKLDDTGSPVVDDQGNTVMELVAEEPAYSPNPAQFVNEKIIVKHVSHTLTVEKVAEGATPDNSPTFTFEVTLTEGNGKPFDAGTVVKVNGEDQEVSAGGKITVTISEFDENGKGTVDIEGLPEGTIYSVEEIDVPRGWAMTEIDGEGTLTDDESATFTAEVKNQYEVSGLVTLEAEKKFDGGEIEDGQFEFGLYADEECAEQLQLQANGVLDETKGTAKVVFDPITLSEPGTYKYYIKEVVPAEDDPAYDETIQYSDEVITATVVATDTKHNGTLDVEVTYDPETATVTNTKKPGTLEISKEVLYAGADKADTAFPIAVALNDADGKTLEGEYAWTSDRDGVEGGTIASGGELQIHGDETITITGLPEGAQYEVTEDQVEDFTLSSSEGTEGEIASNETATAKLVNTFTVGTTATLEAHKTLKGGTLVEGAFTFQLKDAEDKVVSEVTNDGGGNITFDELSYGFADADKVFNYTIVEVAKDAEGVEYDHTEYGATVSVSKTSDGKLEAEVAYNKGEEQVDLPEFVNTYTAAGSYTPTAFKVLEGHDLTKGQFTFTVSRPNGSPLSSYYNPRTETDDEGNQTVIPAVTELTATNDVLDETSGTAKVVFDPIMYTQEDAGKTITYIVTEVDDSQEGTTYDVHAYRVDVSIIDNGDGTLSTSAREFGENRDTFINTYMTPAEAAISVKKVLAGLEWSEDTTFTFTLTADKANPDANAVPETRTVTITKDDAADNYTKAFESFAISKAGSYKYYVQESKGDITGLNYDTSLHEVTIKVEPSKDGTGLVVAEGSSLTPTVAITNHKPDKPDFEKKVADVNDSTDDPLPTGRNITLIDQWGDSADHDLDDVIPFKLTATLKDDITAFSAYHLTFDDTMEQGLTYQHDARVVITDADGKALNPGVDASITTNDDDHGFSIKVAWDNGDEKLPDSFKGAKVSVYFTAKLTGEGVVYGSAGNMNAAKLTYSINTDQDGTGPEHEESTEWDNVIVFTYKVDINKVDQTGEALEGAEFRLEKWLSDGTTKEIESNVSGNTFSFKGLDDGTYVLSETKAPKGYRKADDITFTVTADHKIVWDAWTPEASFDPDDRNVALEDLKATRSDEEIDANDLNGQIKFVRDDTDALTADVKNDKNVEAKLEATKAFSEWGLADSFTFRLEPGDAYDTMTEEAIGDGTSPMPVGEDGEQLASQDVDATKDAAAVFGSIAYEVPGTYKYTITEVVPEHDKQVPGVTYDGEAHEVTVTVNRPKSTNTLKATVSYEGKSSLTITNTFASLKKAFEVTKELTGRDWTDNDSFTFKLEAVTADAPMPAEAERTATATKASRKVATFGEIEFKEAGTYQYTITEQAPDGAEKVDDTHYLLDGVKYEVAKHTVTIDVEQADDSNDLVIHSLAYDGAESLTVTNRYEANGEVKLAATKTVSGDAWPEGATFDFVLKDAKGDVVDTATATAENPTALFDTIKYEHVTKDSEHEYTYTVTEKIPAAAVKQDDGSYMLDGITYSDAELEVKVSLTDNGDGTLTTAVTADGRAVEADESAIYTVGEFENVAFSRIASVELNKLLYGEGGLVKFRMTPVDEQLAKTGSQAAVAQADGTYLYSPTQFVEWTADVPAGETTLVTSPDLTFYKRGTYRFLIEEVEPEDGWDEATILATITIGDNEVATVTYEVSPYDGADFEPADGVATLYNNELVTLGFRSAAMRKFNGRQMVTAWQPEIRKVLENGVLKDGEFSFELRDGEGNLISTATNDENGLVRFDAIRYERAATDAGTKEMTTAAAGDETYTYTVTEVTGNEEAVVYSDEAITFTVTVSDEGGDLVATSDFDGGESVEVPTITNRYDTVKVHATKYSREDLEKGIETPLVGAHYGLWMVNPDGNDVYLGSQESGEDGGLLYDIPTLEGVAYYFKEEEPPPAGHLVDPYPTDYFTLIITDDGSFDLVYEYEFESQEKFMEFVADRVNG